MLITCKISHIDEMVIRLNEILKELSREKRENMGESWHKSKTGDKPGGGATYFILFF